MCGHSREDRTQTFLMIVLITLPMKLLHFLTSWLPRQCHLCHLTLQEAQPYSHTYPHLLWCQTCIQRLTLSVPRCQRCGLATTNSVAQCGQCLSNPPLWDRLYCLNDYQAPLKDYIQRIKYHRQFWLANDLSSLLASQISQPAPELLPVPLHWRRLWQRGFNQSADIAEALAHYQRQQGQPCQVNYQVFHRTLATPQQKGLSQQARQRNTKHAFQLITPPQHSHVALVDDVVTTGATITPLCRALRKIGVSSIDVYCLSRTPSPK